VTPTQGLRGTEELAEDTNPNDLSTNAPVPERHSMRERRPQQMLTYYNLGQLMYVSSMQIPTGYQQQLYPAPQYWFPYQYIVPASQMPVPGTFY